jgi:hypothetical protein
MEVGQGPNWGYSFVFRKFRIPNSAVKATVFIYAFLQLLNNNAEVTYYNRKFNPIFIHLIPVVHSGI